MLDKFSISHTLKDKNKKKRKNSIIPNIKHKKGTLGPSLIDPLVSLGNLIPLTRI